MRDINEILKYTKPLTLLYVEHDDELRQRNKEIFLHYFREVVCTSNASDAFSLYVSHKGDTGYYFDVVITDIEMPRINGIELSRQIYSENANQKLIALSAHNEPRYLFELINMGVSNFLLKPITGQALSEALYSTAKSIYDERLIRFRTNEVNSLNQKLKAKIVELNSALQKADEATKQKDLFMAHISHEIRTPMNGVIGLSELLLKTDLDEKQTNYLVKVRHSAHLMLEIINDLLDYSKIEAGKMTIESIDFDINDILEHIADMISLKAHEKNLDLAFFVDKKVSRRFMGDPLRIGQIILNLMGNAIKFTNQGSVRLNISVLKEDHANRIVKFDVIDTGIGLTPEESSRVFESFSQANESTTRKFGGTGLGLNISKQFANLMGGDIVLTSVPGEGSCFSLTLPLTVSEPNERGFYHLPSPSMVGKTVLIIDPSRFFADSLTQRLHYFHYTTDTFKTVDAAAFDTRRYDIIMVDVQFLEALNAIPSETFKNSKIVALGNSSQLLTKYPQTTHTIEHSLAKPCSPQMVYELILELYDEEFAQNVALTRVGGKYSLFPIKGAKILLAEDNAINRQIILGLLENTEIEVVTATNGLEAIKALEHHDDFDLILMDIEMPIIDGYQAARTILSQPQHENLPIIALTGNVTEEHTQKIKEAGMKGHLKKPLSSNEFYAHLLRFIPPKTELQEEFI